MAQAERFVRERIVPNEQTYLDQLVGTDDWREWKIPPILEELKAEAKALGLWNLFLPDEQYGAGLDNRDYAPVAEITGRSFLAPEVFNCSAPDTGNAEVLVKYGSDEQKKQWLDPLLAGEIRSGFAMTEPAVASSDATNMQATCEVVGDEVVLNGQKWWTSGAGDPRCGFYILHGRHRSQRGATRTALDGARPNGRSGREDPAHVAGVRSPGRAARPRRGALRQRTPSGEQHHRWARPRL